MQRSFYEILEDLRAAGRTIFFSSHILSEVERVCDRVAIVDRGRVLASGLLDELLRGSVVRIRATGLAADAVASLGRFGRVLRDQDWLAIDGAEADAVPAIVAAIVSAGGLVHAVDPGRRSLEDLYVELTGAASSAAVPGRAAGISSAGTV